MLPIIQPGTVTVERVAYMPEFLRPLAEAPRQGAALEPAIDEIVLGFGFDSFMYGTSAAPYPHQESKSYVFTTLPPAWIARYDEQAYIEEGDGFRTDPSLSEDQRSRANYGV